MSVSVILQLDCDWTWKDAEEPTKCEVSFRGYPGQSLESLRGMAAYEGWTVSDGKDLCHRSHERRVLRHDGLYGYKEVD